MQCIAQTKGLVSSSMCICCSPYHANKRRQQTFVICMLEDLCPSSVLCLLGKRYQNQTNLREGRWDPENHLWGLVQTVTTMKAVTTPETFSEELENLTFSTSCFFVLLAALYRVPYHCGKSCWVCCLRCCLLACWLVVPASAYNNAGHRHNICGVTNNTNVRASFAALLVPFTACTTLF